MMTTSRGWSSGNVQVLSVWKYICPNNSQVAFFSLAEYTYLCKSLPEHRIAERKGWADALSCDPVCGSSYSSPCCSLTKSCPTLCNPTDCSPPGSSVHGISQARILERVAISQSTGSWIEPMPPMSPAFGRLILYQLSHKGNPLKTITFGKTI